EPGIGKTRTAQELAIYAATRRFQVLWGRCYEEEGAPPYWPWVQLLRSYVQSKAPEQLRSELGSGAAEIAEILPEVRENFSDLGASPALEPEQARFRLFDSITKFLMSAAQSQPLMLVLDDLHWADRSSLLLLEFLARRVGTSPILVLGTYRNVAVSRRHPLSQALGDLIREQPFLRLQLTGLTQPEVERLIQRTFLGSPSPGLEETIHQRTQGNPLFVCEVVRMLAQRNAEEGQGQDQVASIPEGVRDAIGRRLNSLSDGCNQVLTTASVIGREFDFSLLGALNSEMPEEQLLAVIDEALAAGLVGELPDGSERYQFSHALIQDTLSQELSNSRKVRLHAQIAAELEKFYGPKAEEHASELAYHFAQAEPVLGSEKLVRYSLLAGEQALAAYSSEESITYFERGLEAKGAQPMDAETAALLFGLGRSQAATLPRENMHEAVASLNRSLDYYIEAGDVAGALLVAEYTLPLALGRLSGVAQLVAKALALIPPDSHQAGRLLSNYGRLLGTEENDYDRARESLDQALVIARRENDTALEMRSLANAARVNFYHCHYVDSLEQSQKAIELARQYNDSGVEEDAHVIAAFAQCSLGHLDEARQHAEAALVIAEGQRDRYWLANVLWRNQTVAGLGGDWALARSLGDRALAVAPKHPAIFGCQVLLEYELGNFESGELLLERYLELIRSSAAGPTMEYASLAMVAAEIARVTGAVNHIKVAAETAQVVTSSPNPLPFFNLLARAGLALVAVIERDLDAAAEQYAALKSQQGTVVPFYFIAVDYLLGLLSQTMGKQEQALSHFESARDFSREAGYRPELAWTCCDYAYALLNPSTSSGRADLEDHAKSQRLLDEALTISQELGMRPLMERVLALQEQVLAQPEMVPAYPDGLTQREVEVLRLVAAGKTDREIGEELFISNRTVTTHVSNILNKTGAANRAEAAAYASRHGLA
ncbi:MAG: AAA family ATPase, partial [Dehalococcoidia bacterium]